MRSAVKVDAVVESVPYERVADLPPVVREYLPRRLREVYRQAFNEAYERYRDPQSCCGMREQASHEAAWAAVERADTVPLPNYE